MKSKRRRIRTQIVYIFLLTFIPLFLVNLYIFRNMRTVINGVDSAYEGNRRLTELRYLQAQINPHFLFNTLNAGVGFEMDAIASCYIGGVAVSGGVGRVTNTIIGTLVIMSLTNGMNLMGIDISFQYNR